MKKEILKQGILLLILFFGIQWISNKIDTEQSLKELSYTQFVSKVKKGEFKQIVEENSRLVADGKENGKNVKFYALKLTDRAGSDSNLINAINSSNSEIKADIQSEGFNMWGMLSGFLQIAIILFLINRVAGNSFGTFGKSKSKVEKEKISTKFSDIAGIDEVKEELVEVVDFLKNPEKFKKTGAHAPKGVLLLGEPGTGKTLLAKAVAGEADASFFNMSGSEFMDRSSCGF